jgi:hypothetical protein
LKDLFANEEALRGLAPGESVLVLGPVALRKAAREFEQQIEALARETAVDGHPAWCMGPPVCAVSEGLGHVGRLVQVGATMAMLAGAGPRPALIGLSDPEGEICLPVAHGDVLADVLHEMCRAAANAA